MHTQKEEKEQEATAAAAAEEAQDLLQSVAITRQHSAPSRRTGAVEAQLLKPRKRRFYHIRGNA